MPSVETLLIFTVAAMVLNLSPGPSNFFVMACSIAQGPRAGVISALGLASGAMVHVAAAALGVSAIFSYSAEAYMVLKYVGAAYLVWLGIQQFRAANAVPDTPAGRPAKSTRRLLRDGAMVEILNPKTALFFLALLPQFVDPAAGSVTFQLFILGMITVATAIPCDLMVAFGSARIARMFLTNPAYQRAMDRLSGGILVVLGLFVAVSEKP